MVNALTELTKEKFIYIAAAVLVSDSTYYTDDALSWCHCCKRREKLWISNNQLLWFFWRKEAKKIQKISSVIAVRWKSTAGEIDTTASSNMYIQTSKHCKQWQLTDWCDCMGESDWVSCRATDNVLGSIILFDGVFFSLSLSISPLFSFLYFIKMMNSHKIHKSKKCVCYNNRIIIIIASSSLITVDARSTSGTIESVDNICVYASIVFINMYERCRTS